MSRTHILLLLPLIGGCGSPPDEYEVLYPQGEHSQSLGPYLQVDLLSVRNLVRHTSPRVEIRVRVHNKHARELRFETSDIRMRSALRSATARRAGTTGRAPAITLQPGETQTHTWTFHRGAPGWPKETCEVFLSDVLEYSDPGGARRLDTTLGFTVEVPGEPLR